MKKVVLDVGETVSLHSGAAQKTFTIIDAGLGSNGRWYQAGGSALCFDAVFTDDSGIKHFGKLKKFYLSDTRQNFSEEAMKFASSYRSLLELISSDKGLSSIKTFIPRYELLYDEDECPYIWTFSVPMQTFRDICKKLIFGNEHIEEVLLEIVTTLKTVADCVRILHENNLLHGDITPDNFGFTLRDGKILKEGVTFFDLGSLRYVWQNPISYTKPYYDSFTNESNKGNRADIRAIGINFCKALGCSDEQIESIKDANTYSKYKIKSLVNTVFDGSLFRRKGSPEDKQIRDQIIAIIEKTVPRHARNRVSSCSQLVTLFEKLELFLLPYCTGEVLGRGQGIEIVNKEQRRKDRVKGVFQFLLYNRPLFQWEDNEYTYRILIVGFGLDAQHFLDVCLETAQSMRQRVEIYIWESQSIEQEVQYYLEERPALNRFFVINNNDKALTGPAYGYVFFHKIDSIEEQMSDLINVPGRFQYIYIAAGNDSENISIANDFTTVLEGNHTAINCQCEQAVEDTESIHYVCIESELKDKKNNEEIERMSFNTHLVWSGTLNTDLEHKRNDYNKEYFHDSCASFVLSIKYKLHNLGIDISGESFEASKKLKNSFESDPSIRRKMIASEHRRWVTEKICDGWVNMKVEDCLQYNDSKDILGKRHICILTSSEKLSLRTWRREDWDDEKGTKLWKLDELDQTSVKLHLLYKKYALLHEWDKTYSDNLKDSILAESSGYYDLQRAFEDWYNCLIDLHNDYIFDKSSSKIAEKRRRQYEQLYIKIWDVLDRNSEIEELQRKVIKSKIQNIYTAFEPIARCLKYQDYKKNDVDLIDKIPFILTYSPDIEMVVPMDDTVLLCDWDNVRPSELFSYVAAATIVNPQKLYLPYILNDFEQKNNIIEEKKQALIEYLKRKGLQTEVQFICLSKKTALQDIIEDRKGKIVYLEDNETDIINKKDIYKMSSRVGIYQFDMKNIKFLSVNNAEWLNDIKDNESITGQDVMGFLGRKTKLDAQPYFRKEDIETLFQIYSEDRSTWIRLCKLLETNNNKNDIIAKFSLASVPQDNDVKKHIYTTPFFCQKSIERILQLLINKNIINKTSNVFRHTADSCKTIIFENSGCSEELNNIFAKPYLLVNDNSLPDSPFSLNLVQNDEYQYALCIDSLTVKGIKFDLLANNNTRRILKILERLQEEGFILFDNYSESGSFSITYGSRQIKRLFMKEGNFLEVYVHYKMREQNIFDDVVQGIKILKLNGEENEIDCLLTKGFQTLIIECKARDLQGRKQELISIKEELNRKILKYGINGSGYLVIDSDSDVPIVNKYNNIPVISKEKEIEDIGGTIEKYMFHG